VSQRSHRTPAPFQPSPGSLGALTALGAVTALLSLLLWAELVLARAGGAAFCALSDPNACARLWDGPFAGTVHRLTGLPVAGWGLAWALVAAALPLVALIRAAEGRPHAAWLSAVRIAAAGGVVAAFVLVAAALQARTFCLGCFLTYALLLGYAGIALVGWRPLGLPQPGRAAGLCVAALAVAFGLLLYPGLATPSRSDASGLSDALRASGASGGTGAAAGSPRRAGDDTLSRFVASLDPRAQQALADSLHIYRSGIALPVGPARTLLGTPSAPLRITEFTDIRCDHCAQLQETLAALERESPAGSFTVEPRQFPLDGECNRSSASRAIPCAASRRGRGSASRGARARPPTPHGCSAGRRRSPPTTSTHWPKG
jgi:hypothetical protein